MDVPAHAKVECTDGPCGESSIIILNPTTREVSHFVVQDKTFPDRDQRLVPVDQVVETSRSLIRLRCTRAELAGMDHFFDSHYAATEKEPALDWPVDYTVRSVPRATLTGRRYAEETRATRNGGCARVAEASQRVQRYWLCWCCTAARIRVVSCIPCDANGETAGTTCTGCELDVVENIVVRAI